MHELRLGAAADDERASRLHQAREEPASNGAAGERDEDEGRDQEQRRLDRRVDPPAGKMPQALGEDQEEQRPGEHRVEDVAHLVEARDGDLQAVVLVEVVRGEDRDPDRHSDDRESDQEPGRRRDRRQVANPIRDGVSRDVRDQERDEIPSGKDPGPPTLESDSRCRYRRHAFRSNVQFALSPFWCCTAPLAPLFAPTVGASRVRVKARDQRLFGRRGARRSGGFAHAREGPRSGRLGNC